MASFRSLEDIEITEEIRKRFFIKTKKSSQKYLIDKETGKKVFCLEWTAANKSTYEDKKYGVFGGKFDGTESRTVSAHRMAYYIEYGIDPGPSTDHLCYNTLCVEPLHLLGCSIAENNRTRRACISRKCIRGHEFTEKNTYITKAGMRNCRECAKLRDKERYKEKYEKEKLSWTHTSETVSEVGSLPKKLDWEEVREVRKLHCEGFSQRALARQFRVSQPMIGLIVNGQSWREEGMLLKYNQVKRA